MDDLTQGHTRPGGTVAPQALGVASVAPAQATATRKDLRFELRDPFSEVTHRAKSFEEMVATAERLGALRFVAIEPDGKRTLVSKDRGQWLDSTAHPESQRAVTASTIFQERAQSPETSSATESTRPKQAISPKPSDARLARLEADLADRYVIRRPDLRIGDVAIGLTEYRQRTDVSRVAFTESGSRLSAETNSPSTIKSMVDVAEIRGWRTIRVSGSDEFKRLVWLEASLRQVRTYGYEPTVGDRDRLRIAQPSGDDRSHAPLSASDKSPPATKQSARGGSRKAVLAAIEALLVAQRVPAMQRNAVMAAAAENFERRLRNGDWVRVKVFDPLAPSQRTTVTPLRERQSSPERPTPSR